MNFTYYNNSKTNNTAIIAVNNPPPLISEIIPNRSVYSTTIISSTDKEKKSRYRTIPQRNPIRHYRRQYSTIQSSQTIDLKTINMPGKTIIREESDCTKCNLSNTTFINQEIKNNNEPCHRSYGYQDNDPYLWRRIGCNNENNIIKPAQTNIAQNSYAPSVSKLRERRARENKGQTIDHNYYSDKQVIIKNNPECNNNNNNNTDSFISNKQPHKNGTISISCYKQQYIKRYNEKTKLLNNSTCCNESKLQDPEYFVCRPNAFPNTRRGRMLCR